MGVPTTVFAPEETEMKMIRMAALIAAAAAAASKAKEYARENPESASETLDKVEAFVAGRAGPKYADKVGKGSRALRSSLGLSAGAGGAAGPAGTGPVAPASPSRAGTDGPSSGTGNGAGPAGPPATFDPSI